MENMEKINFNLDREFSFIPVTKFRLFYSITSDEINLNDVDDVIVTISVDGENMVIEDIEDVFSVELSNEDKQRLISIVEDDLVKIKPFIITGISFDPSNGKVTDVNLNY